MRFKGIDDVENHTQEDDSHAEADGNDKYGIQFSDKRYGLILSTGRSHRAGMTSSNPKILPNIRPKNVEKTPAQADDSGKIDMLQLVQELILRIKSRSPCPDITETWLRK